QKYFKARLFLRIGKFIIIIALIYYTKNYIYYLIGSIFIAFITQLFFRLKVDDLKLQKFDSKTFKYFILFSWPFIFHGIAINLLGSADKFILEKLLSLSEVGLYTFAYSF